MTKIGQSTASLKKDIPSTKQTGYKFRKALWPPFFDGELRLFVVMAISRYGPLRHSQIVDLIGKPRSTLGIATAALEKMRIVTRILEGRKLTIALDPRHPAAEQIRTLGRFLFNLYLKPKVVDPSPRTRLVFLPTEPKYDPATLDMAVLGSNQGSRMIYLLNETGPCPSKTLWQLAAAAKSASITIRYLEDLGIVWVRGTDRKSLVVGLNEKWRARSPLRRLLRVISPFLPEYRALAEVFKRERALGQHTYKWKVNNTRKLMGDDKQ